jgi:hypothetical protein
MNYRPIDIADRKVTPRDAGAKPELLWLPLDALVIDNDFQRPLGRTNWISIHKIAEAFSWSKFTPVVVAPIGDGRFSIIDGQHRCHGAKLAGISYVPCMCVDLTVPEQAAAFGAINGQVTAISTYNIYAAALVARAPWAIACEQVVADAGARLMKGKGSQAAKKAGDIYTISLIRKHVEAGRGAVVTTALKALWSAPSCADARVWSNTILAPWLSVLQNNPRAQKRDLSGFMAANDPLLIERNVDRMRATDAYRNVSRVKLMQSTWAALLNKWLNEGGS